MKKVVFLLSILTFFAGVLVMPVYAQKKPAVKGASPVGNDISWPQCGKFLPINHAFGIVGVNGGTASKTNPCMSEQLRWAHRALGNTSQPPAQLYVNTANPGENIAQIDTWPKNNTDKTGFSTTNPYGTCAGGNDLACSWQYGWNRAVEAVYDRFEPAALAAGVNPTVSDYVWWLDVETMNSWQSGSAEALARNAASLEGMTDYYRSKGAKVGVYSTGLQWGKIVGSTVSPSSNLNGLDSWLAGARNLKDAQSRCKNPPLTAGGKVTLIQYISGGLDYDYSCV